MPTGGAPDQSLDAPFGSELRRRRQANGLALAEFASRVHYSAGYLSKVENGRVRPNLALARACDEALDASGALIGLVQPRRRRKTRWISAVRPVDLPPVAGVFVGRCDELAAARAALGSAGAG